MNGDSKGNKILIVFPHDPFDQKSGVQKRFFEFIDCLSSDNYRVDLLSLKNFLSKWSKEDRQRCTGKIHALYLSDFRLGLLTDFFLRKDIRRFLFRKLFHRRDLDFLPDFSFTGLKRKFRKILASETYDFILISYVYWSGLIEQDISFKGIKVLTVEDFISKNLQETEFPDANLDNLEKEEVRRIGLFDRIICLSWEELSFFSSRTIHPEYYYIPVFMKKAFPAVLDDPYELLFIGQDNPNNRKAMDWFLEGVFPLLRKGTRLLIVGRIAAYVRDHPHVKKVERIENPDEIYGSCRIALNPMQDGTGMKVKLIEALSYGIPVISTSQGLTGLPGHLKDQLLWSDDPPVFSRLIDRLLTDESWYRVQQQRSVEVFRDHFDVSVNTGRLIEVFTPVRS